MKELSEKYKAVINFILAGARENFKKDGYLLSVFFVGTNRDLALLPCHDIDMNNARQKERVAQEVRKFARDNKAEFVAFLTEAWIVKAPPETNKEEVLKIRPSQHPDKQEVAIITFEGHLDTIMTVVPIIEVDGKRTLGEAEIIDGGEQEGTFANLLPIKLIQ